MHHDLREKLTTACKLEEFREIAMEMKKRRTHITAVNKFGWYERHQKREANKIETKEEVECAIECNQLSLDLWDEPK